MVGSDIIVVGGGIIGLRIATEISARGQSVVLVADDQNRASDASLVWLNVISTEDVEYAKLRVASMKLWAGILERDRSCPVEIKGALLWDRDASALHELAEFQSDVGWPVEVIDREAFQTLAPGIADVPDAALLAKGEAAADPDKIMAWAKAQAGIARVARMSGCVREVLTDGDRAIGVVLDDGRKLTGSGVILANGMGQTPLLEPFLVDPGLKDAPGMLLRTAPVAEISRAVMASPLMDFWQGPDGRVLIATGTHDTMVDDLEGSAMTALENLVSLAPESKGVSYETLMLRNRPVPRDGLPVFGPIPKAENLWMALTHSGMTLAPVIANGISDMVLGDMPRGNVAPFLPSRMFEG